MTEYRVYALCYGHRTGTRGQHFLGCDEHEWNQPHPTAYYVWLAVSDNHTVLVDAGIRPERAGELDSYEPPAKVLSEFGVPATAVNRLVLTHLHYDHAGTVADFPHARYVVQRQEYEYWTGPWARRITREQWLLDGEALEFLGNAGQRLDFVDGDLEILPGLSVHLVGGHTAGMQVVRVATAAGPVVLASDAAHFAENLEDDRPAPLVHTMTGMYGAFDRVKELAGPGGRYLPGHDPVVLDRFPAEVPGRVVRVA
ncbi:N-acyl homoserine lactonase family protein [Amycolatopsis acidicola]|uniref:N-acyl homoserine lactonase family protein n=1 Tax=Amycolatopsis acidicola TaxID=2596893 RepID=A0A5N0UYF0_9PSEU|nr:N-acyl homoserine lactonase family protein [Amycolatopsis acidicola]KAA9158742.1 N-acyl homoserine lactonase family protein [Amycolatopsis acidicola]